MKIHLLVFTLCVPFILSGTAKANDAPTIPNNKRAEDRLCVVMAQKNGEAWETVFQEACSHEADRIRGIASGPSKLDLSKPDIVNRSGMPLWGHCLRAPQNVNRIDYGWVYEMGAPSEAEYQMMLNKASLLTPSACEAWTAKLTERQADVDQQICFVLARKQSGLAQKYFNDACNRSAAIIRQTSPTPERVDLSQYRKVHPNDPYWEKCLSAPNAIGPNEFIYVYQATADDLDMERFRNRASLFTLAACEAWVPAAREEDDYNRREDERIDREKEDRKKGTVRPRPLPPPPGDDVFPWSFNSTSPIQQSACSAAMDLPQPYALYRRLELIRIDTPCTCNPYGVPPQTNWSCSVKAWFRQR